MFLLSLDKVSRGGGYNGIVNRSRAMAERGDPCLSDTQRETWSARDGPQRPEIDSKETEYESDKTKLACGVVCDACGGSARRSAVLCAALLRPPRFRRNGNGVGRGGVAGSDGCGAGGRHYSPM